jgi:hypothetical protein
MRLSVKRGAHGDLTIRIRTLKFVIPDAAIVEAELGLSGYKSLAPGVHAQADGILYTELQEVFVKRAGGWEMVPFHNGGSKAAAKSGFLKHCSASGAGDSEFASTDATSTVSTSFPQHNM